MTPFFRNSGRLFTVAIAAGATFAGYAAIARSPAPIGVVIVTLDTTRADRLSPYGNMGVRMPALEKLAAEGALFDQATTVAPLTLPAHASLFTGLLPPTHGVRDNGAPPLGSGYSTLAETLHAHGFQTAAFVGSVVLNAERGLARGFDDYDDVRSAPGVRAEQRQRRGDEVIARAIRWLDRVGGSRFFLWAHLYDAHRPYDAPEPFRSIHDPYVGELAFVDSQIGRLIGALAQKRLLNRTILVVVGDHGESLGDHGERDHGIFTYQSVLHVPLIVRAPGLQSRRVKEVVRIVDVMPTLLDLMDLPSSQTDGASLAGLMRGRLNRPDLEAYSESMYPERFGCSALRALREGRFKFIEAPRPELYDLDRDPFEQRNVFDRYPHVVAAFRRRLAVLEKPRAGQVAESDREDAVPIALQERLASLGYVSSSPLDARKSDQQPPDPKDCIEVYNAQFDGLVLPPPRRAARRQPSRDTSLRTTTAAR